MKSKLRYPVKVYLDREEVGSELHPQRFDDICEDLGLDTKTDLIVLTVIAAESDD